MKYCFVFALLVIFCHAVSAARLDFQANPINVLPVLTKLLRIRCSVRLEDGEIHGVRSLETFTMEKTEATDALTDSTTSLPHAAATRRPAVRATTVHTPTLKPVDHVMSIIISRRDPFSGQTVPVARVSSYDPPTANIDQGYIKVEGSTNLSSDGREFGHLEVSWEYPSEAQAAQYTCDVNALDFFFYPIALTENLRVTTSQVTTAELAGYVGQSQRIIDTLQNTVSELKSQVATLTEKSQDQAEELTNTTRTLNNTLNDLKAQNIQSGSVSCPSSGTNVVFSKPYSRSPRVFFFTSQLQEQGNQLSRSYAVMAGRTSNTDFTYSCSSSNIIPAIQWLAIDV